MQSKLKISFGIFLILFSTAVIALSISFPSAVSGGRWIPGPGFFPILLSSIVICCGIIMMKDGITRRVYEKESAIKWGWGTLNVPLIIFSLVLYVPLMKLLGYALATLFFSILLMVRMKAGWLKSSLVSVCVTVFIVILFKQVFRIQLPLGSLGLPW